MSTDFVLTPKVLDVSKSHRGLSFISSQAVRASVFRALRCQHGSGATYNQLSSTERCVCVADSWDAGACHVCYRCHQLQETSHERSGLWVSEDVRLVAQSQGLNWDF